MTYESTGEVRVPQAGEWHLSCTPECSEHDRWVVLCATTASTRVIMRPVEKK